MKETITTYQNGISIKRKSGEMALSRQPDGNIYFESKRKLNKGEDKTAPSCSWEIKDGKRFSDIAFNDAGIMDLYHMIGEMIDNGLINFEENKDSK